MDNGMIMAVTNLINDAVSDRVATFAGEGKARYTDEGIRQAFFEILGDEKLTYQNFRNHHNEIFTIIENVITTNIPLAWEDSTFYQQFVDSRNGAIGERNEFYVEDNSILYATHFAGNHWNTDRQKLPGKRAFSVATEWIYIHVYEELERFLKGISNVQDFVRTLQRSFQAEIDTRVFGAFSGIGTYLPAKFQETGVYDIGTMTNLIQRVSTAAQKNVIIAGTKGALVNVVDGIAPARMSDSQKEELATKGALYEYTGLGVSAIEIPQTFIRGTYDWKNDNNSIYVLPENEKFIKLFFEGDTRALDLTDHNTMDMTFDSQIQTKVGVAVVVSNLIGKYTIAA